MVKHGFSRSAYDCCVYHKKAPSGSLIYLLFYVDDMLVAAKDIEEDKKLKILLNKEFDMKDLGAARKILGMEIIRDRKHDKLFLSQKSYIEKIISRFGRSSAKSVNTPSSANFRLSTTCAPQTKTEIEYMSRIPYASAVGSLMYGSSWKRTLECGESMSAICLAKDQVYYDQTKHIDVRYHFIRSERRIKVKKIGTQGNPADVFTKPVPLSKFQNFFLEYYGISHKIVEVDPIYKKEFKRSHFRKLPVLMVDGEKMVNTSGLINEMVKRMHHMTQCTDTTLLAVLQRNVYGSLSGALEASDYR
nr:retrovirus-related Pol polyprotein from transposon TNT 1-94 [Tanacetum cinerariifolium]